MGCAVSCAPVAGVDSGGLIPGTVSGVAEGAGVPCSGAEAVGSGVGVAGAFTAGAASAGFGGVAVSAGGVISGWLGAGGG